MNGAHLAAGTKVTIPDKADLPGRKPASQALLQPQRVSTPASPDAAAASATPNTAPESTATTDTSKPAETAQEYTVKKGDTLYSIAKAHLGSGTRWPELLRLNSAILHGNPRSLRPGQVLHLAAR